MTRYDILALAFFAAIVLLFVSMFAVGCGDLHLHHDDGHQLPGGYVVYDMYSGPWYCYEGPSDWVWNKAARVDRDHYFTVYSYNVHSPYHSEACFEHF